MPRHINDWEKKYVHICGYYVPKWILFLVAAFLIIFCICYCKPEIYRGNTVTQPGPSIAAKTGGFYNKIKLLNTEELLSSVEPFKL